MLHGVNPSTDQILSVLGLSKNDFGRFRDVYIRDDYIVVHTRNGGGNRDDYRDVFDVISDHPWYEYDEDCDFDSTYADIYFKMPEDQVKTFIALLDQGKAPSDNWDETFNLLKGVK